MRYALIETTTGNVVNVVEIDDGDGSAEPGGFMHIASDMANIGDIWDGAKFIPAHVEDEA